MRSDSGNLVKTHHFLYSRFDGHLDIDFTLLLLYNLATLCFDKHLTSWQCFLLLKIYNLIQRKQCISIFASIYCSCHGSSFLKGLSILNHLIFLNLVDLDTLSIIHIISRIQYLFQNQFIIRCDCFNIGNCRIIIDTHWQVLFVNPSAPIRLFWLYWFCLHDIFRNITTIILVLNLADLVLTNTRPIWDTLLPLINTTHLQMTQ